jgi:uncharacterized protein (TIGR02246 family)
MLKRSVAVLALAGSIVLGASSPSSVARADSGEEIRALFERFVAAQNAHDLKAVSETLVDSKHFLWITRGTPIWGREAALQRFQALYKGTWRLEPAMAEFRVIELGGDTAQIFVPITFLIAPAGQTAQSSKFLMNQTMVKTAGGWRIASILPILVLVQ